MKSWLLWRRLSSAPIDGAAHRYQAVVRPVKECFGWVGGSAVAAVEWIAWHLDVPDQDPEMTVIDEDTGSPVWTRLLKEAYIKHIRTSLLRSSTMEHVFRLLDRGTCRGT